MNVQRDGWVGEGQVLSRGKGLASTRLNSDVDVTHLLHLQKVQPEGSYQKCSPTQNHPCLLPGTFFTVSVLETDGGYLVCPPHTTCL